MTETKVDCSDNKVNLQELISRAKLLKNDEKMHILNIFKKFDIEFTKNSNGYFFNLDKIDNSILQKVIKCIDLIETKRDLISVLDKKRNDYIEYYKLLIETKLKNTIDIRQKEYIKLLTLNESTYGKIQKHNKKIDKDTNIDDNIDLLMKEHAKSKKYKKDSIFYKIAQRTYMAKKHKNPKQNDNDDDDLECSYVNSEIDAEQSIDTGVDIDIDIDVDVEVDVEVDVDVDADVDIEQSFDIDAERSLGIDETDIESNCSYNSDDAFEVETGVDDNVALKIQYDYYKNLLKKDGFKFDDDKHIILKKESYIN